MNANAIVNGIRHKADQLKVRRNTCPFSDKTVLVRWYANQEYHGLNLTAEDARTLAQKLKAVAKEADGR